MTTRTIKAKAAEPVRPRASSTARFHLAELPAGEILANLTDEKRSELAATLLAETPTAEIAKARAAGFREGSTRAAKIIADDSFGGREAAAARMLCSERFDAFTSAYIIAQLAEMPDTGAAKMLDALAADPNPQLGQDWPADQQGGDHGWGKAVTKVNKTFGARRAA